MKQRTNTLAFASLVLCVATPAAAQQAHPHVATHHATQSSAAPIDTASSAPSAAPSASPEPAAVEPPASTEPVAAPAEATPETTVVPEVVVPPPPPALPVVLHPEPRPERWVAMVLAVGSLATTIGFGATALSDQAAFTANPTQDRADITARDGMFADIFLGLTLISAAAAVVLFVAPNADGPRQPAGAHGGHANAALHLRSNGLAVTF